MSQKEKVFSRKQLLVIFKIAFLEAMALSLIIPTISSTGEVPVSATVAPIQFVTSAIGNSSSLSVSTLTSTQFTTHLNDTIVLLSTNPNGAYVKTITDGLGDIFTQQLLINELGSPGSCAPVCQMLELWTAKAIGTGINTVTTTWNTSQANLFLISEYRNVAGIGNVTGSNANINPQTFTIETEKSGSWIVGGMGTSGVAGTNSCSSITPTPGTGLIQRVGSCSGVESPGLNIAGNIVDNATSLPNLNIFSFSETNPVGSVRLSGAMELIATDQEPNFPNFNNFCTTTNGLCVTTQYTINYAKLSTAPNSGTVALATGTAYCTGITTVGLTSRSGKTIQAFSNYGGFNRNVTNVVPPLGPALLVQTYITTTAPSTSFAVGLCSASGNTIVSTGTCLFLGSGGITASTSCSLGMNGAITNSVIGTIYYGFIEITPLNLGIGVGHLQFNQVPANANAMANVALQEQA